MWATGGQAQTYKFDIPSQPAVTAIPDFGRQASVQIVAPAEVLDGVRTPPLKGTFEMHMALASLLQGTGIEIASERNRTIILTVQKPSSAAKVRPPQARPAVQVAQASPQPTPVAAPVAREVARVETIPETVLVTGSLIAGAMVVGAPVTTLSSIDIGKVGALTADDLISKVPSVQAVSQISSVSTHSRGTYIDIHHLGLQSTLVMVNSSRVAHGDRFFFDPSILPTIAIDHVDVLADGASATYGADAVAGVVNLILRKGFDGDQSLARIGVADGTFQWSVGHLFGRSWDGGNITLTYEHRDQGSMPTSARPTLFTQDFRPWGGTNRQVNAAAPGTIVVGTTTYAIPTNQNGVGLTAASVTAGTQNLHDQWENADIFPRQLYNGGTLSVEQRITDDVQIYFDGFYAKRSYSDHEGTFYNSASTALTGIKVPTTTNGTQTANPYAITGLPGVTTSENVNYDFQYELPPIRSGYAQADREKIGLRIALPHDWVGDVFATNGDSADAYHFTNLVNATAVRAAVGIPQTVVAQGVTSTVSLPAGIPALNLFCDSSAIQNCNDPATLNFIRAFNNTDVAYQLDEFGANFSGPVFSLPGGDVKLAVGADYLVERMTYSIVRNDLTPVPTMVSTQPDTRIQKDTSFFGEVDIPIFGDDNAIPLFRRLELNAALRFDDYSTFGSTTNPKVGVNWTVIDGVTLHGTYGTSFRAPTLQEISNVTATTNNQTPARSNTIYPTLPCTSGNFAAGTCTVVGIQFTGGGAPLGPEKATQYTLGLELAPEQIPGLLVQATYYHVDDRDRIAQLGNGATILQDPNLGYLINTNPTTAELDALINAPNSSITPGTPSSNFHFIADALWHNFGKLLTSGWDVDASYTVDTALGTLNAGVTANFMTQYEQSATKTSSVVSYLSTTARTVTARGQVGWARDGWNVTGFVNYTNGYWNPTAVPAPLATHIPDYTTFDLSFGYNTGTDPASSYLQNVGLQIVIRNLFDKLPPFAYSSSTLTGNAAYDIANFDPTGRMFTISLTKDW
jgi:iron complex outermembrane receptor protein